MVIAVAALGFSRYVLDLNTQLTDNITNIVGIGFGTLFRFWSYRRFVFVADALVEPATQRQAPE